MSDDALLVSVVVLVYNHERFIAQALDSILSQKCNFDLEIIVGEDCSKDGSRDIVRQYAARYPHIIRPILYEKNVGAQSNALHCLSSCSGKYIANCEGDDYWTDDTKLQMQIDFLESHPDYSLCFTDAEVLNETGKEQPGIYPQTPQQDFSLEDVLSAGRVFIPTASMVFRNDLPKEFPQFQKEAISGDIALHILFAAKGKLWKIRKKTVVYRLHGGGITVHPHTLENAFNAQFRLYEGAYEYLGHRFDGVFRKTLFRMAKERLIYGTKTLTGIKRQKQILKYFRKYFRYSDSLNFKEIFYYLAVLYFPFLLGRNGKSTDEVINRN